MAGDNMQNFLKLRDTYFNKSLEEFVKDKNETTKTMVYKGELIQKLDPIFMDTKKTLILAHFYAPEKQIFGTRVDTYVVNVIVLWLMTFFLYLILYFRLLKKLLDSGEAIFGKKKKIVD
jgi:preprotein translocase subunit SecG